MSEEISEIKLLINQIKSEVRARHYLQSMSALDNLEKIISESYVPKEEHEISEDDVKLVMAQTNCTEEQARETLIETGDLTEAIIKLNKPEDKDGRTE